MNQFVSFRPEIGRSPVLLRDYPEGTSLADMARDMAPKLPPEMWSHGVARVGGNVVLPEHWHQVRPLKGVPVQFGVLPGDDDFTPFARIGIIGAQIFANLIPGIGPLVSAAIGIGGNLLLAELAPKPKTAKATGGSAKQLGQAGFASNVLQPYEQLGRVLGRKRVAAPHLAPPYVDVDGEDGFAVFCVGLAGRHDISDILINGASPAPGVAANGPFIRTGLPSDGDPSLYTDIRWQEAGGRMSEVNVVQDVSSDERWELLHQSSPGQDSAIHSKFRLGKILPDQIVLDLLFDNGVAQSYSDSKAGVAFQLLFAPRGTTGVSSTGIAGVTYLPEIHYAANFRGPVRAKIIIKFSADPGGLTAPNSGSPWRAAFANTAAQQSTIPYSAHTYYGTGNSASHVGVSDPNIITIYVDPASINIDVTDQLWIKRGIGYLTSRVNYTTNEYSFHGTTTINGRWWNFSSSGGGPLQCLEDQNLMYSTCTIEYCTRIWNSEPFDPSGLTTLEMRLRNIQVDSITFVADGYVRWKWDRSLQLWTSEPHVSENPAEQAYDILRNDDPVLNSRPLSTSLIDDAAHGAWAEFCADNDKRCNAIIESGSVEDALSLCYQAGHGKLVRSRKWAPWIEKDRSNEAPIKIYGPRDFWNWTIEKTFDRKPHALRVTYDDQLYDWITQPERLVYAAGKDVTTATLFEAATYRSIDTDYNADARARLDLAIMRKRSASYSFETRYRWLATPRGSLIGVNHPMLNAGHVTAGIRTVIYDDPAAKTKVMGVILDGEIEMIAGTTGIAISGLDAEVFVAQSLDPGPTRQVMFSTPIDNDAGIDEGALFAAGPSGTVYSRYYVDDIKPGPRGSAKLILVDEAPEIHGENNLYLSPNLYDEPNLYEVIY